LANKLTNIVVGITNASNRYIYDLAGNLVTSMVNGATTVFRYNAQNKLARIEGQGFSYDFLYDSQNRRIASRRNNEDWRFDVHDGAVCIASVTNSTMELFFVRGAGIAEGTGDVLAEIRGSDANSATAVFYVVNHRGDTLNAYVSGIGLIAFYRYDAFGNVIEFSCATGCTNLLPRYTFSTKEYLPDAKVYLYAYRVYDPVADRWTQRDPIDYQDSVNLYCFCENCPLLRTDSHGDGTVRIWSTTSKVPTVLNDVNCQTLRDTIARYHWED
jgi:RHS repeat-associated protein